MQQKLLLNQQIREAKLLEVIDSWGHSHRYPQVSQVIYANQGWRERKPGSEGTCPIYKMLKLHISTR